MQQLANDIWRWAALVSLAMLAGCASPPSWDTAPDARRGGYRVDDTRLALVDAASRQIGVPYRYGGTTRRGFDCSGLVQYAHRAIGVSVPRTTAEQWRSARQPDRRHLMPGDLVFFDLGRNKSRHVGIYAGGGEFIHAPSSGKRVSRASLDNPYWREHLVGARTFL